MITERQLHSKIEVLAPSWIRFLQQLVKIPSYTGEESRAQDLVQETMQDLGIFSENIYYNDLDNKFPERNYQDRPNVVGWIKGDSDHNFILNAHIDTAPVENESTWDFLPFAAEIHEGKLCGRGALDDKAGVAMMLMIAQAFLELDAKMPFDIYFESVIEDEDTGNGSKACLEAGIYADAAIIIDGTWPFRIIDSHLGQLWLDMEILGKPVASCSHVRGINPINIAFNLIQKIQEWLAKENELCRKWYNIDNPYFFTPGIIQSGVFPGAVPEKCNLVGQLGYPPPNTIKSIVAQIDNLIKAFVTDDIKISYKSRYLAVDPFENRENMLVRTLANVIRRLRTEDMEPINVTVTGHCDLRYFRKKNGTYSDACLYGPGGGANPHVKNEYYMVDHFVPVAQNIVSTMLDWYKEARK
jgi:acetylornithine deacetylase